MISSSQTHALLLESTNAEARVGTNNVFNVINFFGRSKRSCNLAYERVLAAYKEALGLDPENISAQISTANTIFRLGRYQEAFVTLLNYSSFQCFSYRTFLRKGVFYEVTTLPESKSFLYPAFEKALIVYEEILRLDPDDTDALEGKGNILQLLGRVKEADLAYRRVSLRYI